MHNAILNIVLLALVIIIVIIFAPLASIWALNTLFPTLAIPYTWQTWLAMFILSSALVYKSQSK